LAWLGDDASSDDKKNDGVLFKLMIFLIFFLLGLTLVLLYGLVWLFFFLFRMVDARQCCWKRTNYKLNKSLKFALKTVMFLYGVILNSALIGANPNSCQNYGLQNNYFSVCAILLSVKYLVQIIYFAFFAMYTPSGVSQAEVKLRTDRVEAFIQREEEVNEQEKKRVCCKTKHKFAPENCGFIRIIEIGTVPCINNQYCLSTDLYHVLRSHDDLHQPKRNCNPWYSCTDRENYLIGFHQTLKETSMLISLTNFKPGGEGMFGGGIYFARSIDHTRGKAHNYGSIICALVDMGRMKIVQQADRTITLEKLNAEGYDSVYAQAGGDLSRDEFIVYETSRVKKFIICT
jgi:hypothetical protein